MPRSEEPFTENFLHGVVVPIPTFLPGRITRSSPEGVIISLENEERLMPFVAVIVPVKARPEFKVKPLAEVSQPKTALGEAEPLLKVIDIASVSFVALSKLTVQSSAFVFPPIIVPTRLVEFTVSAYIVPKRVPVLPIFNDPTAALNAPLKVVAPAVSVPALVLVE